MTDFIHVLARTPPLPLITKCTPYGNPSQCGGLFLLYSGMTAGMTEDKQDVAYRIQLSFVVRIFEVKKNRLKRHVIRKR